MIPLGSGPFCTIFPKMIPKGPDPNGIIFNFAGENES